MRVRGALLSLLCTACVLDATGGLSPSSGGAASTTTADVASSVTSAVSGAGGNMACGNGVVDAFEGCDDAGHDEGDGCSPTCTVEPGFTCRGSPSDCTVCGDGLVRAWETCEDGNLRTDDGCSGCTAIATCGNHIVEPGEACDAAGAESPCTSTCTVGPTSECVAAVDLDALAETDLRRVDLEGDTRGSTDLVFPESLVGSPDADGFGVCVDQGKPRSVPIVKHRWTTGPYPAMLDAQIYVPSGADTLPNSVLWVYRGCDTPTSDPSCNNDSVAGIQARLTTPVFPPLSTAVIAVSGFGPADVGRYGLKVREIQVPWQETFDALPLAAELFQPLGGVTFCNGACPSFDGCGSPSCPDLDYLRFDDPVGPGPSLTFTSPPIARRGMPRVELELVHEVFLGSDGSVSIFVSEDGVLYLPVTSRTGFVKGREIVDLAPFLGGPEAVFRVRIGINGSSNLEGHYLLGAIRVRLFADLP